MTESILNQRSGTALEKHLVAQIGSIVRPPLGVLNHPFLVPGGIFHDELWDWDAFWVAKGFFAIQSHLEDTLRESFLEHAMGSWKNFFEHQAPNGAVPIMIKADNPDFFGCTLENGIEKNQAKPIFGQFALEICQASGESRWLEPHFDGLLRFYERWRSRYGVSCGLLVWGSDVAIGVDSDPTTYGRPEFSSANLLLNCLYYEDLNAAIQLAEILGRPSDAARLRAEAAALKAAVQKECWDETDGFFYTVDVRCGDHRDRYLTGLKKGMDMSWKTLPLKVKMFTGFLPMWCGIASAEQTRILVEKHLRNPAEFDLPWGPPSLARNERMYEPATDSANPSNWTGPVWILANYLIYEGLKKYGFDADARLLAIKTTGLLEDDLQKTGALHECYNGETGAPNFNANYLSWNVLAASMVKSKAVG